ncbi:MAG TPA: sigma 54-interacting transcriptional regulator [Nitrospirales bacterium]|nr:sigma 54-interacting transcriptional regulator [Nitrospirales bacterium]
MINAADRPNVRRLLPAGAASGLVVVILLWLWPWAFQGWEDKTLDLRFGLRQAIPTDSRIVLIDCDDTSVATLGRWPWDRAVHALMVEILTAAGAKAIAFDVVFSVPSADSDLRFMKAMAESRRVYLPIGVDLIPAEAAKSNEAVLAHGQDVLANTLGVAGLPWVAGRDAGHLLVTGRVFMPSADLAAAAAGVGHIASNRDPDGVIRRIPLMVKVQDRLMPAFSLRVAMGALDVNPEQVTIVPGRHVELQGINGDLRRIVRIPVDERGQMLINYAGPWTEIFLPHYGFSRVLAMAGMPDGRREIEARFKGATVLIVATATGFDLKAVPLGGAAPGGLVHANALNTIFTERWLRPSSSLATFLAVLLMGLVGALAVSTRSWAFALARVGGAGLLYIVATIVLFNVFGQVLPLIAPLVAFLGAVVVIPIYEQATVRMRLGALERQMRDAEAALATSRSRLAAHDAEFDRAIDEAQKLREASLEPTSQVQEMEAKLQALDHALHKAHTQRDRLVAQVEELEQRVLDLRPVTILPPADLNHDQQVARSECEAHGLITGDRRMLEVFQMIKKVAAVSSPVLLTGETGTGKELLAQALHALSPRATGPFVAVNMAAITETLAESELFGYVRGSFTGAYADKKGRFEQADRGTLFMDEIGELPFDLQTKLLRVLQAGEVDRVGGSTPRKVDVRIIAATNRNLEEEVRVKRFREDLYYRLNVVQITLPPLRERPKDVELLAQHFLNQFAAQAGKSIVGFSERAMEVLRCQEWRGNVRDLRNAIERAVVFAEGQVVTETDLSLSAPVQTVGRAVLAGPAVRDISGDGAFLEIMRELRFEIDAVAQRLALSRGTVASRFKGICFQAIISHEGRITEAAAEVAGAKDSRVESKVREYYNNLMESAKQFPNADLAILECRRRFKNLPQRYFPAVEQLIRSKFPVAAP